MTALLDVNVLIALMDEAHVLHAPATAFFKSLGTYGWATCPLTENGFLRIFGNPGRPGGPGSTTEAHKLLLIWCSSPGHQFWPDDLSFLDTGRFTGIPASQALTDVYLLALAAKHGGRLATFDRRIDPTLVPGGPAAYFLISSQCGSSTGTSPGDSLEASRSPSATSGST